MSAGDWYPPLAAAGMFAAGVLLLSQARTPRRRRMAERLALVAPARTNTEAAGSMEASRLPPGTALGGREAELAFIARICRRLGVPRPNAPLIFTAVRAGCAFLAAGPVFFALQAARFAGGAVALHFLFSLGAAALGWYAPALAARQAAAARTKEVSRGLPDALELLVVCVEAGLALEDSLDRVTGELRASLPALADELAVTSADLKVLPDRNQAFVKLAQRIDTPAVRSVVTTLSQTLRFGTPLASALRAAAAELRNDALLTLEERAGSLPALMTVPLLLFILPTIFIIVGGPAFLRLFDLLLPHG